MNSIHYHLQEKNTVKLLWTSGWDSTFRLLQLVVENDVTVQPIYILDTGRPSTVIEIKRMDQIKKSIAQFFPEAANRILPTFFFSVHDIKPFQHITEYYELLKKRSRLGTQYDWLSRFASQHYINELELSVLNDFTVYKFIHQDIIRTEHEYGINYALRNDIEIDNPISLFKPFQFPLLDWSKVSMGEHSKAIGTEPIMNLTWFCHTPINGETCGTCNPCKDAIKQGMSFRLSQKGLKRYKMEPINRILRKISRIPNKVKVLTIGGRREVT